MTVRLSIIVPVFNAEKELEQCMQALRVSTFTACECIVVNDASTDRSSEVAAEAGATVLHTAGRLGPAHARNLGAKKARGDFLVFLDADVCAHPDMLERIASRFNADPSLDALIGSYDDAPADPGFFSQYRNLLHHYVHQRAAGPVATFWTGCGAVRTKLYLSAGGLDERYRTPSIEDIDFGYRIAQAGHRIELDPRIQVKHLKRWTLLSIITTDVQRRGIPWTILMLRQRNLPNHLNVSHSQRVSVALVWTAALIGLMGGLLLSIVPVLAAVALNLDFYRFLYCRQGPWFAVRAVPLHLLYHSYNGASFLFGASVVLWSKLLRRQA